MQARMDALETRLKRMEDIEAIRRLTCDYAYYNDVLDGENFGNCFVAEGYMDASQCDPNVMVHRGPAQVRAVNEAVWDQQAHPRPDGGACVHYQINHRVTKLDGDTAEGTVNFLAWGLSKSGQRSEFIGRYEDSYVRTAEGWKFSARVLVPLMPTKSADYRLTEDDLHDRIETLESTGS